MKHPYDLTSRQGMMRNLIVFITPLMLSGILQLLFTASDLVVCRFFGSEHSVGAISSTNALINLIVNLFIGLSVGANIVMARCYGAGDRERGQRVLSTSMLLSFGTGLFLGVFGATLSGVFLRWMGTHEELLGLATRYLVIYFIGVPFTLIYNFGAAVLRAVGDTRRPFYFLTASGIVNVGLNLLFVITFRMDVAGVAIATSISQFLAATAIVLYLYFQKNGFFEFRFRGLRFYGKEALEILRVGIPSGAQGAIFSVSNVMIQVGINDLAGTFGPQIVDGNGAASSLEGFVYTAMNSCAQAVITFGSANYGAKKKENILRATWDTCLLVMTVWAVFGVVILLARTPLLSIYVSNEIAVHYGEERLLIVVGTYFLCGLMDTFAYSLRAIGYFVLPTVISALGACGLRLLWIFFVFPIPAMHTLAWLSASYPISWVITAAASFLFFLVLYKKLRFDPPDRKDE